MKRKISVMLILSILLINIYYVPVHATVLSENIRKAKETRDAVMDFFDTSGYYYNEAVTNFFKTLGISVGFLAGYLELSNQNFQSIYNGKNYGGLIFDGNETDQEVVDKVGAFMVENVSITDNSITFNNGSDQVLKDLLNWYMSNSGYRYVYSYDINKHLELFNDGDLYNATRRFINTYQKDNLIIGTWYASTANNVGYYVIPKNDHTWASVEYNNNLDHYAVDLYDFKSWQRVTGNFTSFHYDTVSKNFVQEINQGYSDPTRVCVSPDSLGYTLPYFPQFYLCTVNEVYTLKAYKTLADLKADNVGQSPYYVTKNFGDFFNNSGNTYTVDDSNTTNITYGDIITYINKYEDDNNEPPTPDQIQIFIDNRGNDGNNGTNSGNNIHVDGSNITVEGSSASASASTGDVNVTVNNNPTINLGGLGSGGTVSGNGSGISNIFGFISDLGETLADLIKNLGSAVVDLVSSIADIVGELTVAIPDLFGNLIDIVFSGLPQEMRAVIVLGVVCMVTFGVIKLFRG